MDPISQGALGAAAAQSSAGKQQLGAAMLAGWLGGMAADLDVFIRSPTDPLLFLEYHRHFTHALIFIPVGGLLVAGFVHWLFGRRRQWSFRSSWLFCTLGYATHGLLDSCTSYGTQLLWPFSDKRFAWDTISIIDPLFTVPLLILLIYSVRKSKPWPARAALLWAACYLSLGWWQHERALQAGHELAASRGHQPLRMEAKPGFGNLLVFKTIYSTESHFYVDAVRVGAGIKSYPGGSIKRLQTDADLPWLKADSQQARDLQRFTWFSDGYVALHPQRSNEVVDIRYSMLPHEIEPMWGIELSEQADENSYAIYRIHRASAADRLVTYWQMIFD